MQCRINIYIPLAIARLILITSMNVPMHIQFVSSNHLHWFVRKEEMFPCELFHHIVKSTSIIIDLPKHQVVVTQNQDLYSRNCSHNLTTLNLILLISKAEANVSKVHKNIRRFDVSLAPFNDLSCVYRIRFFLIVILE